MRRDSSYLKDVVYQVAVPLVLLVSFSGCSSMYGQRRPQFYPNDHFRHSSPSQIDRDTDYCMGLTDRYVEQPEVYEDALRSTATGALVGTATGAVSGTIFSQAGRGAGAGAAVGAIVGLLRALHNAGEPAPGYQEFVNQCLEEKGYRVFQWR